MPTHVSHCVVCNRKTYCSSEESMLGCGGGCYDHDEPDIEFCSIDCFKSLRQRMIERAKIAQKEHPEWGL